MSPAAPLLGASAAAAAAALSWSFGRKSAELLPAASSGRCLSNTGAVTVLSAAALGVCGADRFGIKDVVVVLVVLVVLYWSDSEVHTELA